jgi:hypothetical protein
VDVDPLTLLAGGKKKEDNFSSANLILSLLLAMNVEEANKNETKPARLQRNLKNAYRHLKGGAKRREGIRLGVLCAIFY